MFHYGQSYSYNTFLVIKLYNPNYRGQCGGAFGRGIALQAGRLQVQFLIVAIEFFIDIFLLAALWFWGRLSL
jgi:hypothetical protein